MNDRQVINLSPWTGVPGTSPEKHYYTTVSVDPQAGDLIRLREKQKWEGKEGIWIRTSNNDIDSYVSNLLCTWIIYIESSSLLTALADPAPNIKDRPLRYKTERYTRTMPSPVQTTTPDNDSEQQLYQPVAYRPWKHNNTVYPSFTSAINQSGADSQTKLSHHRHCARCISNRSGDGNSSVNTIQSRHYNFLPS